MNLEDVKDVIKSGNYQFKANDARPLDDMKKISDVWPNPSNDQLHIYVSLPEELSICYIRNRNVLEQTPSHVGSSTGKYFIRLFAPPGHLTNTHQLHR